MPFCLGRVAASRVGARVADKRRHPVRGWRRARGHVAETDDRLFALGNRRPDSREQRWKPRGRRDARAATGCDAGSLRCRSSSGLLGLILAESRSTRSAQGIDLPREAALNGFEALAKIYRGNVDATTSLQRDVCQGKPSELEFQAGFISRTAKRIGVATPVTNTLYALLKPQELRARGQLSFRDPATVGNDGKPRSKL